MQETKDDATRSGEVSHKRVALIQCTKSKRDERSPASDLYDESQLFRKMRSYVQAAGLEWYVLSAKVGLLPPEKNIEPYDEFGVDEQTAKSAANDLERLGVDEVEVIAGRKYTAELIPELERRGIDVIEKCAGLSIGKRMSRLNTLISEQENETVVQG